MLMARPPHRLHTHVLASPRHGAHHHRHGALPPEYPALASNRQCRLASPSTRLPGAHICRSTDSTRSRTLVRPHVRASTIGHMAHIARAHNAGLLFRRKHSTPRSLRRPAGREHHSGNLNPIRSRRHNPRIPALGQPRPRLPPRGQLNAVAPRLIPPIRRGSLPTRVRPIPLPPSSISVSPGPTGASGNAIGGSHGLVSARDKTLSASSSTEPCASSTSMAGARPHGTRQSTPTASHHLGQSSSPHATAEPRTRMQPRRAPHGYSQTPTCSPSTTPQLTPRHPSPHSPRASSLISSRQCSTASDSKASRPSPGPLR